MAEAAHEAGDDVLYREVRGAARRRRCAEIKAAIRKATIAMKLFPVICGSAFKNKGVQPMLDAVVDYLPSPLDIPATVANDPKTGELVPREARDDAPFTALVFKIMTDPFVGQLAFIRVYSGSHEDGRHRAQHHQGPEGAHRPPAQDARQQARGDQGGLRRRHRGRGGPQERDHRRHHLRPRRSPVVLESINFPAPVIALAVEPKTKADQEKLGTGPGRS